MVSAVRLARRERQRAHIGHEPPEEFVDMNDEEVEDGTSESE